MEKSIIDLIAALTNIDKTYITIIGLNQRSKEYQQSAEAAFTAELYHQWKNIIRNDSTDYYDDLQIHYDLTKERFGGKRPDLVLHKGPNSRSIQKLYVEIKTSLATTNYDSDFEKLILAVSTDNNNNQLGYEKAVFLSNSASYSSVCDSIKNFINQKNLSKEQNLEKILSIHLNSDFTVTIKPFSELI